MATFANQIIEDGTVGVLIPMTLIGKVAQRIPESRELGDPGTKSSHMGERNLLHLGTCPRLVGPQVEQFLDLIHGETEIARPSHKPEAMNVVLAIDAVTALMAVGRRQEPGFFVIADHLCRDAGAPRCFADIHPNGP